MNITGGNSSNITVGRCGSLRCLPNGMVHKWTALMTLFCVLGVFLNIVLSCSILRTRALRSGAGILVANMLFSLAFKSAVPFPVYTLIVYFGQVFYWNVPMPVCGFAISMFTVTLTAGAYLESFLAFNRFTAVVFPHRYKVWGNPFVVGGSILASWCVGIAVAVPALYGYGGGIGKNSVGACSYAMTGLVGMILGLISGTFPLIFTAGCYVSLSVKMRWKRATPENTSRDPSKAMANDKVLISGAERTLKRRLAIARLTFFVFAVDAGCYMAMPVFISGFPKMYFLYPHLTLWLRLCYPIGFSLTPYISCPESIESSGQKPLENWQLDLSSEVQNFFIQAAIHAPAKQIRCPCTEFYFKRDVGLPQTGIPKSNTTFRGMDVSSSNSYLSDNSKPYHDSG